jgi:predicted acylesterase/phospholipase RssA
MTKIAYVLSGEGAKGAWQAMALKHLEASGVKPDFIVGTSSGAINAVGYSLLGADKLCEFWRNIKSIKDVFSFNWQFLWQSGVYTTKPLEKKLYAMKDLKLSVPVHFPITKAETGETFFLKIDGDAMLKYRTAIIEAVTIPGVVRSNRGYVDGGAMILCPLKRAIDHGGADEIYVILGRDPVIPKADFKPKKWLSVVAYGNRFLELLMFTVIKNDIANCAKINDLVRGTKMLNLTPEKKEIKLHILYPKRPLYDSLNFKKCREMLEMVDNIAEINPEDIRIRV